MKLFLKVSDSRLGVIHILCNHQGGGEFRNDYANVIFALSNAEFDHRRGEGSRNREKVITSYVNSPLILIKSLFWLQLYFDLFFAHFA